MELGIFNDRNNQDKGEGNSEPSLVAPVRHFKRRTNPNGSQRLLTFPRHSGPRRSSSHVGRKHDDGTKNLINIVPSSPAVKTRRSPSRLTECANSWPICLPASRFAISST